MKRFLYLIYLLTLLSVASCATDDLDYSAGLPDHAGGKPFYMALKLKSDDVLVSTRDGGMTRADGAFHDGSVDEHAIAKNGNFILFFNADKKFIAFSDLWGFEEIKDDNNTASTPDTDSDKSNSSPELILKTECYAFGDELPSYCLVVVNATDDLYNKMRNFPGWDIDEVLKTIWEEDEPLNIGKRIEDGNVYLTMTNSVYSVDGKMKVETEIPDGLIVEDPELLKSDSYTPLTVNIERMVAKYTMSYFGETDGESEDKIYFRPYDGHQLTFCSYDDNGNPQYEARNWRMKVLTWDINGLSKRNYIYKHINPSADYFNGWNDPSSKRCYWSEDPDYDDATVYPWQYRWALDNSKVTYLAQTDINFPLKYYSFKEIEDRDLGPNGARYTPENTYNNSFNTTDKGLFDERANLIAASHLLICSEVQIDGEAAGWGRVGDFYRNRVGMCYRTPQDLFSGFMAAINSKVISHSTVEYTYYNADGEDDNRQETGYKDLSGERRNVNLSGEWKLYYYTSTSQSEADKKNPANYVELDHEWLINFVKTHPHSSLYREAHVKDGDGKVFPWIEGMRIGQKKVNEQTGQEEWVSLQWFKYKTDAEGNILLDYWGYKIVDESTLTDLSDNDRMSLIYELWGVADHFNDGKMYYPVAIPIKVNGSTLQAAGSDVNESWHGVLRNGWYRFSLNSVSKLGYPVDVLSQPIVPNNEDPNRLILVDIVIIPWHVEEQYVPLF